MHRRYSNQLLYFGVAIVFFLAFSTAYGVYQSGWPMFKPLSLARGGEKSLRPTIQADTVLKEEIRYLCDDRVSTKVPTTSDLIGLDFPGLVRKYPVNKGWNIDDSVKNSLIIARVENRVCPYHQDFRHFGTSDGYLAVYEGPLGFNQKILQREDIMVADLTLEMQADLGLAMDYGSQPPDTQARLKNAYEFETEAQLNTVLENFDEFKD